MAQQTLIHEATPDGCVELILRKRGTSDWNGPQPRLFATGLSSRPALLRFSGDAVFVGIRFRPWAWNRIAPTHCSSFADRWLAVNERSELGALFRNEAEMEPALMRLLGDVPLHPIAAGLLIASNVAEVGEMAGIGLRSVQRWSAREIGIEPRRYIRLLRFDRALRDIQTDKVALADHAAANGFSDQAHMARDFRNLAGHATRTVRARAQGPFI